MQSRDVKPVINFRRGSKRSAAARAKISKGVKESWKKRPRRRRAAQLLAGAAGLGVAAVGIKKAAPSVAQRANIAAINLGEKARQAVLSADEKIGKTLEDALYNAVRDPDAPETIAGVALKRVLKSKTVAGATRGLRRGTQERVAKTAGAKAKQAETKAKEYVTNVVETPKRTGQKFNDALKGVDVDDETDGYVNLGRKIARLRKRAEGRAREDMKKLGFAEDTSEVLNFSRRRQRHSEQTKQKISRSLRNKRRSLKQAQIDMLDEQRKYFRGQRKTQKLNTVLGTIGATTGLGFSTLGAYATLKSLGKAGAIDDAGRALVRAAKNARKGASNVKSKVKVSIENQKAKSLNKKRQKLEDLFNSGSAERPDNFSQDLSNIINFAAQRKSRRRTPAERKAISEGLKEYYAGQPRQTNPVDNANKLSMAALRAAKTGKNVLQTAGLALDLVDRVQRMRYSPSKWEKAGNAILGGTNVISSLSGSYGRIGSGTRSLVGSADIIDDLRSGAKGKKLDITVERMNLEGRKLKLAKKRAKSYKRIADTSAKANKPRGTKYEDMRTRRAKFLEDKGQGAIDALTKWDI